MTKVDQGRRRGAWLVRGLAIAGFTLVVSMPAAEAQLPTVPTLPLPKGHIDEPTVPEAGGTAPPTATTTAPGQPPTSAPSGDTTTTRPSARGSQARRTPAAPKGTTATTVAVVQPAATTTDEQAAPGRDPGSGGAVPTARELGFPLTLAALVSAFVAVQGRLDRRDPKLAAAPISVDDDLLPFL